ncbi:hepatocyte growth factor receptor-like [Paramacrobiotus metropolitanus]|uniref:hepatocyte growth factor receptor-like n=1 Tax=Paramacrobiotus metropolitanus TaxID=2943436 RepID=UPI002445C18B|nr:hepatocyte growth factor receptor-like [Paramacrobiotus metropolitanus]
MAAILLLLSFFFFSCVYSQHDVRPRIYEHPDSGIRFQESAGGRPGNLFTLDQYNRIYRLSGDSEGQGFRTSVSPASTTTQDAAPLRSQLLLVSGNETETVLACSDGSACGLANGENWSWSPLDRTMGSNNFSQKQQVLGVVFGGFYYIAAEDSGTESSLPVLSVRELKNGQFQYRKKMAGNVEAKIFVNQAFRNKRPWKLRPVFLTVRPAGSPFGYLITVQTSARPGGSFESRIGRFCAEDRSLMSYMETGIQCTGRAPGAYTIATAGSVLTRNNKTQLAVVFGKNQPGTWETARNMDTAVCVFSLEELDRRFDEEFGKCQAYMYKSSDPVEKQMSKLPWIAGLGPRGLPKMCSTSRDKQCTQISIKNDFIDVKGTVDGKACVETWDMRALQLVSVDLPAANGALQESLAAMYVDNTALRLTELTLSDGICHAEPLSLVPTQVPARQRNQPPAFVPSQLTNEGRAYVVLAENKIQSFPVGCGMHATCSQCMLASKRMGCGWCETGYCSTTEKCDAAFYTDRCIPVVEEFSPQNGSFAGGTEVTIKGRLFGSRNAKVSVLIAGAACPVISRTNDTVITCKTSTSSAHGPVEVTVTDRKASNPDLKFDILGKHHLASPVFRYLAPKIDSIAPAFGPKTGNTRLTVTGRDLRIGNQQEILVAGIACRVISATGDTVICDTGASENSQKGGVALVIDGNKVESTGEAVSFEYRDEPEIRQPAAKLKMTLSGSNIFVFHGSNLDAFSAPPVLVLTGSTAAGAMFQFNRTCLPVQQADVLQCPAVSLREQADDLGGIKDVSVRLAGPEVVGDVAQPFPVEVFPDPEVDMWNEEKTPEFTERQGVQQYIIKLTGKRLDTVLAPGEYHIVVDREPCNVTKLEENNLECRVKYSPDLDQGEALLLWLAVGTAAPRRFGELKLPPPSALPTTSHEEYGKSNRDVTIALAVIGGALTLAVFVAIGVMVRRARRKANDTPPYSPTWRDMESAETLLTNDLQNNLLYGRGRPEVPLTREFIESFRKDRLIIDPAYLEYGRELGAGSFGTVYEGLLRSEIGEPAADARRVAIKTIQDLPTPSSLKEFLKEGLVMKDLRHKNVMILYGICVSSPDGTLTSPGLVMPFMSNGDLHTYIRKNEVVLKDILGFSVQIAEGMAYLSSQKIVHRDLAARNCMLDDELNVRIADFGHSRDLYESNLYFNPQSQTPLPYRWIAPECIHSAYSTKSDVWSFGVVVWELFQKGERPYGELDAMALLESLGKGFRLRHPLNCPEAVYNLMQQCWSQVPDSRPDFQSLCVNLRAIQNALQLNGSAPRYENVYSLSPKNDPDDSDGEDTPADTNYLNGGYFAAQQN